MKKNYNIKLLNQKFTLKSDDDESHVQQASDYVNEKLFEIQQKTKSVSSLNVALLAALNISDDYIRIKREGKEKKQRAKKQVQEIIGLIDQALACL